MTILEGLLENKLKPTQEVATRIFQCTTCRNCYEECPAGVEAEKIIQSARENLVDNFRSPVFEKITENIAQKGNPYGEEMPKDIGRSSLAYFPGCTANFKAPEIVESATKILEMANVRYQVLRKICCGSILFRIGKKKEREELTRKNMKVLSKKTIIVSCAGCYKTLKIDYGIDVIHIAEFLKGFNMKFYPLNAKVTYHDPCHLGRHAGVYDEPREILSRIPGIELIEMERSKGNARCCGAGGGVASGFRELSEKISKKRIEDALLTGAEVLVTACPFCYLNLLSKKIKVLDISMIVAQQLKEINA
jgi:Fe-S oxidoreductase